MNNGSAALIIINARVLTMDGAGRRAAAIAITGNRITRVGSKAEVMALKGPGTRVIDAAGGSVLPGFIEAHMHLFAGAASRTDAQLFEVHGLQALDEAIWAYAAANPARRLLMGRGANYTIVSDSEPVTRHHLDRIVPDRPVSPIDPMAAIEAAVTRKTWADDMPDQSQTLMEAIAGHTRDGAYAEFRDDRKGTLEAGKLADMVVLSGDIEVVAPEMLHAVRPVATICDGRVSFEA